MDHLVERIFTSWDGDIDCKRIAANRAMIIRYIELAGQCGDDDLISLGQAYLAELQNPDPKYTGC